MAAKRPHRPMTWASVRPLAILILSCLGMLIIAQALIGALSLAALNQLSTNMAGIRLEAHAHRLGAIIENGLRLGKPLGQYFGLDDVLRQGRETSPGIAALAVHLPGGELVASEGGAIDGLARLLAPENERNPGRGEHVRIKLASSQLGASLPLRGSSDEIQGVLVIATELDQKAIRTLMLDNLRMLALTTLVAGSGLAVAFRLLPAKMRRHSHRIRFLAPLIALLVAQAAYAAFTIPTFRHAWLDVTRSNVQDLALGLQRDLNRILDYGVEAGKLRGIEAPFNRLISVLPAVSVVELLDASGRVLARAGRDGALPAQADASARDANPALDVRFPLGSANAPANLRGSLLVRLSGSVIAQGVWDRALDAATVIIVATVTTVEMLLLSTLLSARNRSRKEPARRDSDTGRTTRPVMFGYLFAWALPLGFLPLYARELPTGILDVPRDVLAALPMVAEMACGLVGTLLSGRMVDQRGWRLPVLGGLIVSALGMLSCAASTTLPQLISARALVGLGYGLTWMGLQGAVVSRSPREWRGRNMASVIAGVFAGHLSGTAVGSMLVEQVGARPVFLLGASMLLLPLAGVLVLMRSYSRQRDMPSRPIVSDNARPCTPPRSPLSLLGARDLMLLLLCSAAPFSMAQVGLMSYALPLYLVSNGSAISNVGRVLMVYGLFVIYLGPILGRIVDRSPVKKPWIVAGGLIGSAGMLGLYTDGGAGSATLTVLALALASCFLGAAQTPYMLSLPQAQARGAAGSLSMLRAADKLGQTAGPLTLGVAFGSIGMNAGLALIGVLYLSATVAFQLFSRKDA